MVSWIKKGNVLNNVEMHCFMGFKGELIEYYSGYDFSGGVHYINKSGKCVIPKE